MLSFLRRSHIIDTVSHVPNRLQPIVLLSRYLLEIPGGKSVKMKAYQLKVILRYIRPPIWRRLEVRGDTTLGELHHIIQIAMGWTDSHLHQFVSKDKFYGPTHPHSELDYESEDKIHLNEVLRKPKEKMIYEYDFGDGWEHEVIAEKLLPIVAGRKRYPVVTGGRRACPHEDCGGIPGYYHLLDVIKNPNHPEYNELLEWCGGEYEPERFDIQEINRAFHGEWHPAEPKI